MRYATFKKLGYSHRVALLVDDIAWYEETMGAVSTNIPVPCIKIHMRDGRIHFVDETFEVVESRILEEKRFQLLEKR